MMIVADERSLCRALDAPLDVRVKRLLELRYHQVAVDGCGLTEVGRFVVVESVDQLPDIERAMGFSPLENLVDGAVYGEPDFTPSFEWVLDHGGVFEAPFVLSDDGFGWVLFVLDGSDIDHRLLAMLRDHAVRPEAEPL